MENLENFTENYKNNKGGFRKIEDINDYIKKICNSSEHNPPTHIYLPGGKYEYTCPDCGHITVINVPIITY